MDGGRKIPAASKRVESENDGLFSGSAPPTLPGSHHKIKRPSTDERAKKENLEKKNWALWRSSAAPKKKSVPVAAAIPATQMLKKRGWRIIGEKLLLRVQPERFGSRQD